MRILFYSNHQWIEDSFPFLIEHISKTRGVTVETIDRLPAPVEVPPFRDFYNNGYIYPDWDWFYVRMTRDVEDEYAVVCWHEDRARGQELQDGAERRYNGVYDLNTKDRAFNFVVFASADHMDTRTRNHHKRYPNMTFFERIFLHELSHGVARVNGETDRTHYWDYTLHNIPGAFMTYDLRKWKMLRTKLRLLDRVLYKTQQLLGIETWHKPLDNMDTVSQPFGVPNRIYPITGHHVGVDYAVPEGTPVYAPVDCTISTVGQNSILGNWCEIETTYKGETVWVRYLHLLHTPEKGEYKRGEVIALTGNTGMSTGGHLHLDIRRDKISKATPQNFREVFINPQEIWK